MNIQEFKTKIAASNISADRKQKIETLLAGEVTFDIIEQVKDLIQEDIEADTASLLTTEDKAVIAEAQAELSADLTKAEKTLDEDMTFVEGEIKQTNDQVQQLNKAIDQSKIDALKASM